MKKIFSLLLAIMFCTLTLEVQAQTAAEATYNQAVELMNKNNKSSIEKAIKAFRKAKIGFSSQENKEKCQKRIDECNEKLAKIKKKVKDNKTITEDKTAEFAFEYGEKLLKEGKLDEAKAQFNRAKDLFPESAAQKIKECEEQIEFCNNPISFDPSDPNCSANGTGEEGLEIKVKALSVENWIINVDTDAQHWIKVKREEKQPSIKVFIQPNDTENPREGFLTLVVGEQAKHCKIYQRGAVIFNQDELNFGKKSGESQFVMIKASEEWTISPTDSWIFASKRSENQVEVSCSDMNDESERDGSVEICCGEDKFYINVHQVSKTANFLNKTKKFGKKLINKKD